MPWGKPPQAVREWRRGGRVWDTSGASINDLTRYVGMPASKLARAAERGQFPGVVMIPTPEEKDFFAALGIPCWPPEQRTERRLVQSVRQAR